MTYDTKYYAAYDAPATSGEAVTPSDSVNSSTPFRALYVGVSGNITMVSLGGNVLTFVAVPAGAVLPVRGTRVNSTGTTAASLVAIW